MKLVSADKKLFFISWLCINRKSRLFRKQKLFFCTSLSSLSSKISRFHKPKVFYLHRPFLIASKKPFSTLHFPFAPSHNLLSTKEQRCSFYLRSKSLRCNARTSHRFKAFSPPFCAKSRFRLVPPEDSPKVFPAEL